MRLALETKTWCQALECLKQAYLWSELIGCSTEASDYLCRDKQSLATCVPVYCTSIPESGSSCAGDELVPATDWALLAKDRVSQIGQQQIVVTLPQVNALLQTKWPRHHLLQCEGLASLAYLWAETPVTR